MSAPASASPPTPLLAYRGVGVTLGDRRVLAGVDLEVAPGDFVVLAGPNGAGKTTLLRLALGLHAPTEGELRLGDAPVGALSPRERAARVSWLPQHLPAPSPLAVREVVATGRFRLDEPRASSLAAADAALRRAGIADLAARPLSTLSGGQLQRVALATTLAQEAPLLLLDEPSNHLDPRQQRALFEKLGELSADGVTVVCVTHDLRLVEAAAVRARGVRVIGVAGGGTRFELPGASPDLPAALERLFEEADAPAAGDLAAPAVAPQVSVARAVAVAVACAAVVAALPLVGKALPDGEAGRFILWDLRVPRTLVAALVGGTLGIVGAAFQTLFQNPLADSSTIGTMAGATLGGMLAIILGSGLDAAGISLTTLGAFLGAGGLSGAVTLVAASGRARMTDVLLAGIAVSLASGAVSAGLQSVADARATWAAVQWSLGHLPQIGYEGVLLLLPLALVTAAGLLAHGRALESMIGGEQRAHSQGVDLTRLRVGVIGLGALGVAACVAWCGPIAFVGLIVPHVVRRALGPALRVLLPMSWVAGAAFLAGCDGFARVALPGREVPVGVVTAALGAVALVVLIARGAR